MLTAYQTRLQALIQAPNSPTPLVPTASQTDYINQARNQLAGEAECVRTNGVLSLTSGQSTYPFSAIVLGLTGARTTIAVRSGTLSGVPLEIRSYEWLQAYYYGRGAPATPTLVAQQGQGASGTLVFWPIPNATLSNAVVLDCACLPIALVDDATVEAIPELWRDAVPFYAAFLAMQTLQRQAEAEAMLRRYMILARRGRQFATPSELPETLPGGIGSQIAASHTVLGQPPAPAGGQR